MPVGIFSCQPRFHLYEDYTVNCLSVNTGIRALEDWPELFHNAGSGNLQIDDKF